MVTEQGNLVINRELSWLKFNERVLQEANDPSVPMIERLHFIGIFSNNLDEFFKVRYATVKRIADSDKGGKKVLGIKASKLLEEITKEVNRLQQKSLQILENIKIDLQKENIFIINETQILQEHRTFIEDYFKKTLLAELSVIMLNNAKSLPKLKDDVSYLAVKMELCQKENGLCDENFQKNYNLIQFALVEIPKNLDRFLILPSISEKKYIILIDDVIRFFLKKIFSIFKTKAISANMIKITRDAELDIDNDLSKSFIEKILNSVEGRKDGQPVRFVYDSEIEQDTLKFLQKKLNLHPNDSRISSARYLNRRDYMNFPSLGRQDLVYEQIKPLKIKDFSLEESILKQISVKDFMIFTPYHKFSYLINFLREAAIDPNVKTIKMTIYRLAKNSQIVRSLIDAARNGKKVVVQIELRARFDEAANIQYAEELQREGIKVMFGIRGLKIHSKFCVIERQEKSTLKKYGFISTGNFNEKTAKIYTDYTLFTSNQIILKDLNKIFNFFETPYQIPKYKKLFVSPHYTKKEFISLINNEIENAKQGKEAFIKIKINGLTNHEVIDKLYEASRSGVKIQMIVRGSCCLIPQVKAMSENIEIISIVDKFLEHTRLYIFCNGGNPKIYISSADLMTRNLENRVEVSCPISDPDLQKQLCDIFEISWQDTQKARIIDQKQENNYKKSNQKIRSQQEIYEYFNRILNF